ncbi:MAG TPA: hypothetical protein VIS57_06195, partial [Xanthomonadales bacterium]
VRLNPNITHFSGDTEMKSCSHFIVLLLSSLFLMLPIQACAEPADDGEFVNSIKEEGQCGQGKAGKLQYLQNADVDNAYEVTVKTTAMRQGESSEMLDVHNVKAGGKKTLGCTLSDIMPLTSYSREIVSETKKN